ncbi:MAG: TolC family protein, partial [Candidatus Electrothrix sp. AR3]|nr:TolC family protein [Candidatus Electrothrix sp. AR3]
QAIAAHKPSVDANGSVGLARYSDSTFSAVSLSNPDADQTYENASIGLQASWLLFDGYARKFNQEQAEYGEEASTAAKENSQRLLLAAVAAAFFNAQLAQTSVEIAVADQEFYEQQLSDAQHRFEAGAGSKGDVLNIKVQLNAAKASAITGRREQEAARYGLAALLGLPNATLPNKIELAKLDKDYSLPSNDLSEDVDELIEEALRLRPDLNQMTLQVKTAKAAIGQAKAKDWPLVQLLGQVNSSTQGELFPSDDDLSGSLALNVSWNLYSAGTVEAAVAEARQMKREATYNHANLRNSIAAEIRQDIARLQAARRQVQLQRESVELVKENRELAESEYEAGSA